MPSNREIKAVVAQVLETLAASNDNFQAARSLADIGGRTLSRNEVKSIRGLIAYTAHANHNTVQMIEQVTLSFMGAASIEDMDYADFDDAIKFLVDYRKPN